ncbi:hypothetical protein [uncultured Rikenella sp.]|uniref:hypothetical protein n=1 Tax=uncultured Rikenella sp. TaxID=368003 RepID=UPI00272D6181|nr:hypothetical protein [uncultured Rikenella sp.]
MLQIYVDDRPIDLSDDISIDLVFENPLFSSDRIPATYSLSYDLPLTPRNRQVFGNPDRVAAAGDRFRERPARILFAGLEIASGVQTIEEISGVITVNFSGSVLPAALNRKLYHVEMDKIPLSYNGSFAQETSMVVWDGILRENMKDPDAPFFAPPLAIKDAEPVEPDPDNPEDSFLTTRRSFVNLVDQSLNYIHFRQGSGNWYMLKILPAVKVWYLFDKIFGDRLERNIFKEGEWSKLCLQTLWHPDYKLTDNLPPWTPDKDAWGKPGYAVWLRDFMPDVWSADFVVEMLKLPCASMYVRGDRFSIESNTDVLSRNVVRDIRLEEGYTISREAGQKYVLGHSEASNDLEPADVEIRETSSVVEGMKVMDGSVYVSAFRSRYPPQVLQADSESVPHLTIVKAYRAEEEEAEESDVEEPATYDMTIQAQVVQCNVHRWLYNDADLEGDRVERFYIPEIERIEAKRPDTILLGLYQGIHDAIRYHGETWHYPYMSSSNYNAYGEKLGELSLDRDRLSEFSARHTAFKQWIERDKLVITGQTYFTALDLHELDLRDKFTFHGRRFFIRTMNISLKKNTIEPAEVELVEV